MTCCGIGSAWFSGLLFILFWLWASLVMAMNNTTFARVEGDAEKNRKRRCLVHFATNLFCSTIPSTHDVLGLIVIISFSREPFFFRLYKVIICVRMHFNRLSLSLSLLRRVHVHKNIAQKRDNCVQCMEIMIELVMVVQ